MKINKNYNESNLETMSRMPDNFIDLVVTSPPYGKLRKYNGFCFDFHSFASALGEIDCSKRNVEVKGHLSEQVLTITAYHSKA